MSGKRKIFVLGILVLLLIGGGCFWWWKYYETPPEKWDEAKYSKPEDYEIIETPEGTFVENKKAGLSFKVPEGWRVEKKNKKQIFLFSSGAIEKNLYIMETGCRIFPVVLYNINTSIETLREELNKSMWRPHLVTIEVINIDGHKALKYTAESSEFYRIGVSVPIQNFIFTKSRVYSFGLDSAPKDKEKCIQEFEQFLNTISIK